MSRRVEGFRLRLHATQAFQSYQESAQAMLRELSRASRAGQDVKRAAACLTGQGYLEFVESIANLGRSRRGLTADSICRAFHTSLALSGLSADRGWCEQVEPAFRHFVAGNLPPSAASGALQAFDVSACWSKFFAAECHRQNQGYRLRLDHLERAFVCFGRLADQSVQMLLRLAQPDAAGEGLGAARPPPGGPAIDLSTFRLVSLDDALGMTIFLTQWLVGDNLSVHWRRPEQQDVRLASFSTEPSLAGMATDPALGRTLRELRTSPFVTRAFWAGAVPPSTAGGPPDLPALVDAGAWALASFRRPELGNVLPFGRWPSTPDMRGMPSAEAMLFTLEGFLQPQTPRRAP
jgi:hypothetical protein